MSDENHILPKCWAWATLKDLVCSITYGYTESATTEPVGPRFLRITDIQNGCVNWETVPYCKCDDVDKYALKNGDIVIARTGATTGKSFLIGDLDEQSVFASYLIRLETLEDFSAVYLSKFMQTMHYWKQITTVSKGSAQPGVNASILSMLSIPVAPLAEQRRIVAKIDALQERSRKAREALAEVGPLLEQFRQSLLAAAFRGDLTADWRAANPNVEPASELLNRIRQEHRRRWEESEFVKYEGTGKKPPKGWQDKYKEPERVDDTELPELPVGWCWTTLGEVTLIDSGEAFKKKNYSKSGIRLLQIANVSFGHTLWYQENFLPESFRDSFPHLMLDDTDITIALNRPILNGRLKVTRISTADLPAILYQRVGRMRTAIASIAEYLFAFMRGPSMLKQVESKLQGSDQPYINTSDIPRIMVPLAPFDEQAEIVRICISAMNFVGNQLSEVVESESDLTQLDQSILAKAFRGELVPQDPNDEPASVLLERIHAVRQAAASTKSKRKGAGNGRK